MPRKKGRGSTQPPRISRTLMSDLPDTEYEGGWQASDTPQESWSECTNSDPDGQWPVDSVVAEELDWTGTKRYEIKWQTWQRHDGTDTTWERDVPGDNDLLDRWTFQERKRKQALARKTRDITLSVVTCDPHNIWTAENMEAYTEKLAYWGREPPDVSGWDNEIETDIRRRRRGISTPSATPKRVASKNRKTQTRSPSLGSERQPTPPQSRRLPRRSTGRGDTPVETPAGTPLSSRPQRMQSLSTVSLPRRTLRTRATLEGEWNECTRKAKAAPVSIVNDVDDEEYPPVDGYFQYRESRCLYGQGVPRPSESEAFMVGCNCTDVCDSPSSCSCQTESEIVDEDEGRILAYDEEGLFRFNHEGREVVECNKMCSCSKTQCPNRVAQRPREIPIEVFKTPDNGWGARATEDLPKGKVLGLYTGRILLRDDADEIPLEDKNYIFDLDTRDEDEEVEGLYSVDATTCGNWTRFVNHSCEPVATVYSVVIDTVLERNMPRLAFATNQELPARTEITIDYNPSEPKPDPGRKGKMKIPHNRSPCFCGADRCRGWL